MKNFLLISLLCIGQAIAGFEIPKGVFKSNQMVEASAAAAENDQPLVIIYTSMKST